MADRKHSLSSRSRRRFLQHGATLGAAAAMPSFITVEALGADKAKVSMQLGWLIHHRRGPRLATPAA